MKYSKSKLTEHIDTLMSVVFLGVILFSLLGFFMITGAGLYQCGKSIFIDFDVNSLFKGIEFIFIAPLPILIANVSFSFYKKIIKWYITDHQVRNIDDANEAREEVLVDLSLTKYMFISTLSSTVIVVLIQFLYNQLEHSKPGEKVEITPLTIALSVIGLFLLALLIYFISQMGHHLGEQLKGVKDYRKSKIMNEQDVLKEIQNLQMQELEEEKNRLQGEVGNQKETSG